MKIILVDAVDTFVIKGKGIFQEMYELLKKYPHKKIILTNANDNQIIEFGSINLPYPLFTLKNNPNKTDQNYFRIMLKNFNLTPEEVIYFEQDINAVKSAESVGIKSYPYNASKKDLIALKEFLDENL